MKRSIDQDKQKRLKTIIASLSEPKKPISTDCEIKLASLEDVRAVFFDVYGTILISGAEPMEQKNKDLQYTALEETFNAWDISYKNEAPEEGIRLLHEVVAEVHKQKKAKGKDFPEVDIISVWRTMLSRLKEGHWIVDYPEEELAEMVTDFVTRNDQPWLMPHLQEVLEDLTEKKLEIGIISNSQFYTPLTLEALSGKSLEQMGFDKELLFWSFNEDIAKPSVHFYEIARKKLQSEYSIETHQVLFVGNDMLNDVYPAQKAGFKTALFGGDKRSLRMREDDNRVKGIEADIQITQLVQILECL
ncbi:MAG: HAD family hydrolase [Gracilimonas sp.]|nr:HAD family hydrolase [Gracilimonas sp.]